MVNSKRRIFLRRSGALAVAGALCACGGSGANGSGTDASGNSVSASSLASANSAKSLAATTLLTNANFTLTSPTTQAKAPYTLGYAFQQGDVPAGSTLSADAGTFQVIPKNTWPDGSLKFAVLSGVIDLVANTPKTVNMSVTTAAAKGTALTTGRLRFTNAVASISADGIGTATWSGADWDSPFATWVSGPTMASWIYRKPVGSDKHLVAWLEVRLFDNGMVEVLPWIENGYLLVAAPTNKNTTYTFTLGGAKRFSAAINLLHHQRTPLISGTVLSYWLGTDPGVVPSHNKVYLQATELVPSYLATVDASAGLIQGLVATYQPLQSGNFNYDGDSMASSGYQDPIGLLPQHDVLYLTSSAPQTYAAVVRNGFSAGRWGIHYRDEKTNRPPRFSSYPHLNIGDGQGFKDNGGSTAGQYTPVPTGGNPPQWDVAHSPSVGYLAYLVTGRWYFMEEVQFAATANYLGNGDNSVLRDGAKGLVQPCPGAWQTRACAWDWRAKVQALAVTPDADTALRSEFIASVEANIAHFYGRYVAQSNNPYGWVKPGEVYDDGTLHMGAPWQQDFVTAAFGYAVSLGLPISSTATANLASFFQWKAKSVVMRLGAKTGFWYVNAVPYNMAISPASMPDYDGGTGPWLTSDAQVYAATYTQPFAWMGSTEGTLAAEYLPGERAMWGNLMPAIAYAVRHGVAGASTAFSRLTSASNWATLRDAFNVHPVWGIQPAKTSVSAIVAPPVLENTTTAGTPAWLAGAAINQWVEISGTAGAGGSAVDAYSGFGFKESTNEILIAAAGGHSDSSDNRVVSLSLMTNAPTWRVRMAPSTSVAMDVPYYPDGKPTSRHLYNTIQFVPQVNRLMLFGIYGAYGNAYGFGKVDGFNLDTNTWDPPGTWSDMPSGHLGVVTQRSTGEVWSSGLARWSPATKSWTQPITARTNDVVRAPIAHDSLRNQLFTLNWGDDWGYGTQAVFASIVPCAGSTQTTIKFNSSAALTSFMAEQPTYAAMDYDPDNDRFLFYCGKDSAAGKVYVIKPNSGTMWDMSVLPLVGSKLPPATPPAGVHNRFRYVPALKGFLLMPSGSSNLFFIRTA